MKKDFFRPKPNIILVFVLSLATVVAIVQLVQKNRLPSQSTTDYQTQKTQSRGLPAKTFPDPCGFFSLENAVQLLGSEQIEKDGSSAVTKSADWTLYYCRYKVTGEDPSPLGEIIELSLKVFNESGNAKKEFDTEKVKTKETVNLGSLGDSAYWSPVLEQVRVLSGQYYVTAAAGRPKSGNNVIAQKAALIVVENL